MQTENEKAVRDQFDPMLLEGIRVIMNKYGYQCRDMADEIVDAAWQAALQSQVLNTDGWVMVPVEPTNAMVEAAEMDACGRLLADDIADAYSAMLSAAPKAPQQQEQSGEVVTPYSLQTVVSFLCGEGPMDGVWFGEAHPRERGKYWWRKYLRAATSPATPTATAIAAMVIRQALELCNQILPKDYNNSDFATGQIEANNAIVAGLRALTPANAEAELEALLKDAGRYRALREHFKFANDSVQEIWFDASITPERSDKPEELDEAIDTAIVRRVKGE